MKKVISEQALINLIIIAGESRSPKVSAPSLVSENNKSNKWLQDNGLIESEFNLEEPQLTMKGKAYIKALQAVKMPKQIWK